MEKEIKYDYSLLKIDYPNRLPGYKEYLRVICLMHGEFTVRYDNHKYKKLGCTKCNRRQKNNYWTLELCKNEALKYKTRTEWNKKSSGSYTAAWRMGWIDQCCQHMVAKSKPNN